MSLLQKSERTNSLICAQIIYKVSYSRDYWFTFQIFDLSIMLQLPQIYFWSPIKILFKETKKNGNKN
jgi:hypothetical protein